IATSISGKRRVFDDNIFFYIFPGKDDSALIGRTNPRSYINKNGKGWKAQYEEKKGVGNESETDEIALDQVWDTKDGCPHDVKVECMAARSFDRIRGIGYTRP